MSRGRIRFRCPRYRGCAPETLEIRLNLSPLLGGEIEDDESHEIEYERDEYERDEHEHDEYEHVEQEDGGPRDPHEVVSTISVNPVVSVQGTNRNSSENDDSKDHADHDETPEFEELEGLLEDAHESDTNVELEDHHAGLVDEVIAHLAEELLVPAEDIRALVVKPTQQQPFEEIPEAAGMESLDHTAVEADASEEHDVEKPVSKEQLNVIGTTPEKTAEDLSPAAEKKLQTDLKETGAALVVQPSSGERSNSNHSTQNPTAVAGSGEVATDSDTSNDMKAPETNTSQPIDLPEMKAAGFGELPTPGFGIRFGTAPGLVNDGIRLSFELGADTPVNLDEPLAASVLPTSSGTAVFVTAALAGGVLAVANADRSPALQKIARRIRRSIHPAV